MLENSEIILITITEKVPYYSINTTNKSTAHVCCCHTHGAHTQLQPTAPLLRCELSQFNTGVCMGRTEEGGMWGGELASAF